MVIDTHWFTTIEHIVSSHEHLSGRVSTGVCQTADELDFMLFRKFLADAIAQIDRRVVILACGGLSQKFWPLREFRDHEAADPDLHLSSPEAAAADRQVLDWMLSGNHSAILEFLAEFRQHAPERYFGHYQPWLAPAKLTFGSTSRCIGPGLPTKWEIARDSGRMLSRLCLRLLLQVAPLSGPAYLVTR